jgi:hypothetical protein
LREFIDAATKHPSEGSYSRIIGFHNYLAAGVNKRFAVYFHGPIFQHWKRLLTPANPLVAVYRCTPVRQPDANAHEEVKWKTNNTHQEGNQTSNHTFLHLLTSANIHKT